MNRVLVLTAAVISSTVFPGWSCGTPVLQNPSFDLWCGNKLCAWTVDQGQIRRVPTWHPSDFGVELVGDPVVISQSSAVTPDSVYCFHVEFQVDKDPGVKLSLQLYANDVGLPASEKSMQSQNWVPNSFDIEAYASNQTLRFAVRKAGAGRAVIATIFVTDGCSSVTSTLQEPQRATLRV